MQLTFTDQPKYQFKIRWNDTFPLNLIVGQATWKSNPVWLASPKKSNKLILLNDYLSIFWLHRILRLGKFWLNNIVLELSKKTTADTFP
jgi:hypothetical protein